MQAFRAIFAILPLILLAGALLLLILTLLAGGVNSNPINKFYYLQAAVTTPNIDSTDGLLRWTNYNACGVSGGVSTCGSTKAAYGFNPVNDLGETTPALPAQITNNNSKSKLTSKVFYAFLLIAAFFTMVAMFSAFLGCCGRLGAFLGFLSATMAFVTCAIAAALMTTVYVRARNNFRAGGIESSLGVKLFAFVWTAVACTFLAWLIFLIGVCVPGESRTRGRKRKARSYQEKPLVADNESYHPVQPVTYVAPEPTSVYEENGRSSYERANTRSAVAAPLDGNHTTTSGTGATYLR